MNPQTLMRLMQVTPRFMKAQDEIFEPEIIALRAAHGAEHAATVGLGVLVVLRDIMTANTFPEVGNTFDQVNESLFSTMMSNLGEALHLDHEQVADDVRRIAGRMGEAVYPEITAAIKAQRDVQPLRDKTLN